MFLVLAVLAKQASHQLRQIVCAVAMGYVERPLGTVKEMIASGGFEIEIACERFPAQASLRGEVARSRSTRSVGCTPAGGALADLRRGTELVAVVEGSRTGEDYRQTFLESLPGFSYWSASETLTNRLFRISLS